MEVSNQICAVCGSAGHGIHFGIIACRACSSFFRRSMAERKNYVCRSSNKCVTKKGLRNVCRACRFRNCLAAGMTIENLQRTSALAVDSSPNLSSPGVSTDSPLQPAPTKTRLLNSLIAGIYNYKESEKSLYTVRHPEKIFAINQEFSPITDKIYEVLLKTSLTLMYSMFREHYPPFVELDSQQRLYVIKEIFYEYTLLYQGYQSMKYFPGGEKVYHHYGYHLAEEGFFSDPQSEIEAKAIGLFPPIIARIKSLNKRISQLNISDADLATLTGTLFCEALRDLGYSPPSLEAFRDELFTDYHNYLMADRTMEMIGKRGGNVFCVLLELKSLSYKMHESRHLARVFISNFFDHWHFSVEAQVP